MSTVLNYSLAFALLLAYFGPSIACALKGKWGLAALGLLFWLPPIVGMIRLAKPKSVWARKWYGADKRARAAERFEPVHMAPMPPRA